MRIPGGYIVWFWREVERLDTRRGIAESILKGNIRELMGEP